MARADARKKAASSSAAAAAGAGASSTIDAAHDPASGEPPMPFEAALSKLEEVVDRLEGGELDLEVALASFEEGVRLTRQCAEQLDAAERRIEVLTKEGDRWTSRPFEDDTDHEPDQGEPAENTSEDEGWED